MNNFEEGSTVEYSISERIQKRMKELGLSQADVMRATKAARGTVSGWVNGSNNPSAKHIESLATCLQTNSSWLLTGNGPTEKSNFNMREFMNKHGVDPNNETSFDVNNVLKPTTVNFDDENNFIWIDVIEANFSRSAGKLIEFHFDVIHGKFPFLPSFFHKKNIDPEFMIIIKAKGDSMTDFIHDDDLVGIDISQTEIVDGEIYAVYFEGEVMIKQIFKQEGGKLELHSLNSKYRDREVSEQNGLNFKVIGRQFWRAG